MSLSSKTVEIQRFVKAFETEAANFHDVRLSTYLVTQEGTSINRKFISPNHNIMLWQYYGPIATEDDTDHFATNLQKSELQWGLRGAKLSSFALLEGPACHLFVRMAQRAGSLFDEEEAGTIKRRVVDEILQSERSAHGSAKPIAVTNSN